MRSLFIQYLLPVVALLTGIVIGSIAGSIVWGVTVGFAVAVALAILLSWRARRLLANINLVAHGDDGVDLDAAAMGSAADEIATVLRSVAQQQLKDIQRHEDVTRLLTQQTQVLDRMNDGLMRVAADGRVTYANVAAGSLFGGRNPTDRSFMSVTRDHELNGVVRRCLQSGGDQQHTFEIPGEGRLVSAVITRLSDRPAEALVMLRDITEVNRLQNLRRDFVSNVSHELRTPLSTIKILTETLLDLDEQEGEASGFLRKIDAEVDSMTALVRDLLDLTRLETASGRLVLREIDVALLVEDVCNRMRPLAERHGVDLNSDSPADIQPLVADERRLHQALINLITNAIVHTPAGGSVTVRAERAESGAVRFSVVDTGVGIPADDLPRVWERFFKTDRARTGTGTGLGLAIVKHIVQAHDGAVAASSTVGAGSTFSIEIPPGLGPVAKALPVYERSVAPN